MATADDLRVTLAERYGIATTTSNLRVGEKRGDADLILAAGLQPNHLGVQLLRLQGEYDGVKAELAHADESAHRLEAQAKLMQRADSDRKVGFCVWPRESVEIRRRSEGEIITARYLILQQMGTLRQTKMAVWSFAMVLADKQRFRQRGDVVQRLSAKALDIFLDPTCGACEGTGVVGSGYLGETMRVCDRCGGSAHRRDQIGSDARARWFGFLLLGDLQKEAESAARAMGRLLRNDQPTKETA